MEDEEEYYTAGDVFDGGKGCRCCGKDLTNVTMDKVFVDSFLFKIFGYIFCDKKCRDSYINSK